MEHSKQIEKYINDGYTIVCDRYYYSGMVYSVAKSLPNLGFKWARASEIGLPRPDLIIFLDLNPEEAEKRGGYGDEKYEKLEMQLKVREGFHRLSAGGEEEAEDMVIIDAGSTIEQVHEQVVDVARLRVPVICPKLRTVKEWRRPEALDGINTAQK